MKKLTDVGATNDFRTRIRRHNNLISGGARVTTNLSKAGYTWRPMLVTEGFPDQRSALQHEVIEDTLHSICVELWN
ncbi:MAG: hypothetical protein EOP45_12340 [Sphingobacteriaceae bacterium]|nr:MAG: hypothetical protein EOP45_12340 [Sphingobacteriaceae bacterium]